MNGISVKQDAAAGATATTTLFTWEETVPSGMTLTPIGTRTSLSMVIKYTSNRYQLDTATTTTAASSDCATRTRSGQRQSNHRHHPGWPNFKFPNRKG